MIFFSQRKPKAFDYKPRYYDPEKECRELRRRELCGPDTYRPNDESSPECICASRFTTGAATARTEAGR